MELLNIILPLVAAIVTAPVASWLTSHLQKREYEEKIRQLHAEVDKIKSDVKSSELDNVRKASGILMDQIVEPLKKEMTRLRYEVNRFRKALDEYVRCPHADACPVHHKLRELEKGDSDSLDLERDK